MQSTFVKLDVLSNNIVALSEAARKGLKFNVTCLHKVTVEVFVILERKVKPFQPTRELGGGD